MLAVLVGIAVRRRWCATLAFPLYLLVGAAHKTAQVAVAVPERWLLWLLIDASQNVLALCVAVEIGARIFHRDLPGGRAYTGRIVLVILVGGALAAISWNHQLALVASDRDLYFALIEGSRRVTLTAAVAFSLIGFLVVSYFDWPLDPYHRDVASGFLVYQWASVLLMPWPDTPAFLPHLWPVGLYTGVLLWWAVAAWRHVDTLGLSAEQQALALPWIRSVRP
jgi:hypothetical protein